MKNLWKKLKEKKILRINVKVDLTFYAFKPYKEKMVYVLDGKSYTPTSFRFLCFALIVVKDGDLVEQTIPNQKDIAKLLSKK